ncbi:MAG TPA: cytochrome c biogenesis protein CcdA [Frankiaceae bacterium]|nr:cytochrome c biogenesis protein CcdA [Frankiaceae bacterium]
MNGIQDTVLSGPLLAALPLALLAGLVSFLSPCVLPLVPGYLSYITGLTGADLAEESETGDGRSGRSGRRRAAIGALLFVLGFSVVFVSAGAVFGAAGRVFSEQAEVITRVLGGVTIVLGLAFMGLLTKLPFLSREFRFHALPVTGLAGAPLLGVLFGVGWTPCAGPTLTAVNSLAYSTGTAGRGAVLSLAYCIGLGLPFVLAGLAFERSMSAFAVVKRHYALVTRLGGAFLVVIGVLLVTGYWGRIVASMQVWIGGFETVV